MVPGKRRKKLVLINRDFQLRYARAAVGVGITTTALTTALILVPLFQFEILRIATFLPLPILIAMLIAAVLNVIFVAFMGIFITHRIAGPLYSLVRSIREVGDGNFGAMTKVRDEDDLKYVVRNFSEMQEKLVRMMATDIALVDDAVADLPAGESPAREALMKLRANLQARVRG